MQKFRIEEKDVVSKEWGDGAWIVGLVFEHRESGEKTMREVARLVNIGLELRHMKYEKAVKIEELAAEVFDQTQVVMAMRMQNTPSDLDKQREGFIKLKLAEAKLFELEEKLSAAKRS